MSASQPSSANPLRRSALLVAALVLAATGFIVGRNSGQPIGGGDVGGSVKIVDLPAPPKDASPAPVPASGAAVVLETPSEGATVGHDFEVSGRAKVGSLVITVRGSDGVPLVIANAESASTDRSAFGRFSTTVKTGTYQGPVTLTVAPAGAAAGGLTRNLRIADETGLPLSVFFGKKDSGADDCAQVFPVARKIPAGAAAYREAVTSLLAGPTAAEKAQGYATALATGAKVKSIAADASGIVTVDFDRAFEKGVAGSCRVTGIRSQVEATLRQFPEVRGVVILIEGRSDTILQP